MSRRVTSRYRLRDVAPYGGLTLNEAAALARLPKVSDLPASPRQQRYLGALLRQAALRGITSEYTLAFLHYVTRGQASAEIDRLKTAIAADEARPMN